MSKDKKRADSFKKKKKCVEKRVNLGSVQYCNVCYEEKKKNIPIVALSKWEKIANQQDKDALVAIMGWEYMYARCVGHHMNIQLQHTNNMISMLLSFFCLMYEWIKNQCLVIIDMMYWNDY